jgi:endonuclease/exonuclease/phosphatase family metal-dependent hydrolase
VSLRVLTHNLYIHANTRPALMRRHARALVAVLRERDVAIACLQEVPRSVASILVAQSTRHRVVVRPGPWPEEALVLLLHRDVVRAHRDVDAPAAANDGQFAACDLRLRGVAGALRLIHAHLDFYSATRRLQATELIERTLATANTQRVLACGDFNESPADSIHGRLLARGLEDVWSATHPERDWPGTFHGFKGLAGREVQIDWILSGGALTPRSCELLDDERLAFSDHLALIADFDLNS